MANSIGIIDKGYRGKIMAKVDNIKTESFIIKKGTRLFQIVSPIMLPINITIVNKLSETSSLVEFTDCIHKTTKKHKTTEKHTLQTL